jgi:hypothetical protein
VAAGPVGALATGLESAARGLSWADAGHSPRVSYARDGCGTYVGHEHRSAVRPQNTERRIGGPSEVDSTNWLPGRAMMCLR